VAARRYRFTPCSGAIADQIAERIQILAAISHDLQTPITRMRLRTIFWRTLVQRKSFRATCRKCRRSANRVFPGAGTRPRREQLFQTDLYALSTASSVTIRTPENICGLSGTRDNDPHTPAALPAS